MSKLEDKAVDTIGKLETFAGKLVDLSKQYAPDVWNLARQVARIEAIQTLVYGFVWLVIASLAWVAAIKLFRVAKKDDWDNPGPIIGMGVGGIIGLFTTIAACENLLNIYAWVSLWYPELWMAKKVLGL